MHVLVAGCGWLGTALARALLARGDRVTGVRRHPERAAELAALGVAPLALDLAAPDAAGGLPADLDAFIACQAAGGDGVEAYRRAYLEANQALLSAARRSGARAFVYTGSTGIFGQRDGSDVDEATQPAPSSPEAEVLVEAERLVLGSGPAARVVRLSGLYGPGRTGLLERVRSGALALGPGDDAWMNFCHRDDAVSAVLAALDRGRPAAIYHGSDAQPVRRREVVRWVARALGVEPVTRAEVGAGRGAANRRILSERTRAELGLTLAWPSFADGFGPLIVSAR